MNNFIRDPNFKAAEFNEIMSKYIIDEPLASLIETTDNQYDAAEVFFELAMANETIHGEGDITDHPSHYQRNHPFLLAYTLYRLIQFQYLGIREGEYAKRYLNNHYNWDLKWEYDPNKPVQLFFRNDLLKALEHLEEHGLIRHK